MQYAILCYREEAAVDALSQQEDDALMASLAELGNRVVAESKLGPVAPLMPTTAATTLRYGGDALVVDGPFAETKEALLGLYVVECASLQEAMEVGRRLIGPRVEAALSGAMETRPVRTVPPGSPRAVSELAWLDAALTAADLARRRPGLAPGELRAIASADRPGRPAPRSGRDRDPA